MKLQTQNKKRGGRKAGVPNKQTRLTREWIGELLDGQTEKIIRELSALEGRDYLRAIAEFVSYIIPKAQPVQTQTAPQAQEISDVVKGMIEATNGAA